jgi:hypothetical protein
MSLHRLVRGMKKWDQQQREAHRPASPLTGIGTTARILHQQGQPHIQRNCVLCRMTPAGPTRIWRKTLRAEAKGIYRRHQRTVETQPPRKGSTWARRHMQALPLPVVEE